MPFNVGVKDLISTGGDSRPSCIQMLANRSHRGTSKGDKVWHSLTLEKKMKVNKFDIASQNPGFPCPHVNTEQSFWGGGGKLHFLCGWKAKTHRIKPRACRQTVSKKYTAQPQDRLKKWNVTWTQIACDGQHNLETNVSWKHVYFPQQKLLWDASDGRLHQDNDDFFFSFLFLVVYGG